MTWTEASQLSDQELNALQDGMPDLPQLAPWLHLIPNTLLDLEGRTTAAVDEAVLWFAATRKWPRLSQDERSMLVFRLEYAASLSFLLGQHVSGLARVVPEPSLDVADEHILEWLLIHAWHLDGFGTLHETTQRLLRSLQPAPESDH